MYSFDPTKISDDELKSYDEMMGQCVVNGTSFSTLASGLWVVILKELDRRQLVRLISGSYDDVGNAYIQRLW